MKAGLNILIVDDEIIAGKVMASYLNPYGVCDVITEGRGAVEQVEQFIQNHAASYDLICLDINMPGMDGLEVLQEIRRLEAEYGIDAADSARVIMATLMNDSHHVSRAFMNQCEIYLVKPIQRDELLRQLVALGLIADVTL